MENEDENENAFTIRGIEGEDPIWPILISHLAYSGLFAQYFDVFADVEAGAWAMYQERIKGLRELIPHIGSITIVIPLKIFLDLL